MARRPVDADEEVLSAATVNAALREVARRSMLADFDVLRDIDGTPEEVQFGREDRDDAAGG